MGFPYTFGQGLIYTYANKIHIQMETFHNDDPGVDKSFHGYEGPFHVSHGGYASKGFQDDCIRAAAETGLKEVPDANDLTEANGIQVRSPSGTLIMSVFTC